MTGGFAVVSGEHLVAPVLDCVFVDDAFEKERVSFGKCFCGLARAEEGHVASGGIGEGADADDLSAGEELIEERPAGVAVADDYRAAAKTRSASQLSRSLLPFYREGTKIRPADEVR